jgi:PEP-CTERM motif
MFGTSSWANAGGDFVAASSGDALVSQSLDSPYRWGSTAAMVADVQSWLDSPSTNFGWLLMGDEVGSQTFRQFYTREAQDSRLRPELTIDFTPASVPEPSTLALAGTATLVGLMYARWRSRQTALSDPDLIRNFRRPVVRSRFEMRICLLAELANKTPRRNARVIRNVDNIVGLGNPVPSARGPGSGSWP